MRQSMQVPLPRIRPLEMLHPLLQTGVTCSTIETCLTHSSSTREASMTQIAGKRKKWPSQFVHLPCSLKPVRNSATTCDGPALPSPSEILGFPQCVERASSDELLYLNYLFHHFSSRISLDSRKMQQLPLFSRFLTARIKR